MNARQRAVYVALAAHSGPFAWGIRDCVTLAADVVEQLRGVRPVEFTWHSEEEAAAEIAKRGGLHAALCAALGDAYDPALSPPADGDVVLLRAGALELVAIWAGTSPVGPSAHGLHRLKARHVVAGWSV